MGLEIKKNGHTIVSCMYYPELFADTHYLSPGEFIFIFLALDFKIELQPLSDSNPNPKPNPNPNSYPKPNPNPNEINLAQTLKTD